MDCSVVTEREVYGCFAAEGRLKRSASELPLPLRYLYPWCFAVGPAKEVRTLEAALLPEYVPLGSVFQWT